MGFRRDIWHLRSAFYQKSLSLPFISSLHQSELDGLKSLLSYIQHIPKSLLDIGFGSGGSLSVFPETTTIFALDWSPAMMKQTNRLSHQIHPIAGDALTLPAKSGSFPLVSAIGLLEYIEDKSAFLLEVGRILSPGGHALLTFAPPNLFNRMRIIHGQRLFFISKELWEDILSEHWQIIQRRSTLLQEQFLIRKK